MGGSSDVYLSFLAMEDCTVMVLQIKTAREEHPGKPGIPDLNMDPAFPRGKG
jgi:hypothetical protein